MPRVLAMKKKSKDAHSHKDLGTIKGRMLSGGPRGEPGFVYFTYLPDWFRSLIADTVKEGRLGDEEKAELADLQNGLDAAFMRFDLRVPPDLVNDIGVAVVNAALITSYAGELSIAKMREDAAAFRKMAGKKSGETRLLKMEASKARVLTLAREIRGGNPTLAQTDLAASIAEKRDPKVAVGRDRILTYISQLEADKRLPRAQRRRNP